VDLQNEGFLPRTEKVRSGRLLDGPADSVCGPEPNAPTICLHLGQTLFGAEPREPLLRSMDLRQDPEVWKEKRRASGRLNGE
jgi:hypothetical protein